MAGMEATVCRYRFESAKTRTSPSSTSRTSSSAATAATGPSRPPRPRDAAEFEPQFDAFLDSFRLTG